MAVAMELASFHLVQQTFITPIARIARLALAADGTAMAAATTEGDVAVIDPGAMTQCAALKGHRDAVTDVQFHPEHAAVLASCSLDGTARLWDLRTAVSTSCLDVKSDEVYSCSIGVGGQLACAAGPKVILFDFGTGKRLRAREDHSDIVNHVRFHPVRPTHLLSGADDGLVCVSDLAAASRDDDLVSIMSNDGDNVRSFTLVGPERSLCCCASMTEDVRVFSLDGESCGTRAAAFMGLRDHPLVARDECSGYVVETLYDEPSAKVMILAGSADGDLALFCVGAEDMTLPVAAFARAAAAGAVSGELGGHSGVVRTAVCLPGGIVASGDEDGRLCAWREQVEREAFELQASGYRAERSGPRAASRRPGGIPY